MTMDGEANDDEMMMMSLLGREDEGGKLNSWRHCGGTFLTFSPSHPLSNSLSPAPPLSLLIYHRSHSWFQLPVLT